MRITVDLAPGEFLDRFAVLMVKHTKLGTPFAEDCNRYSALAEPLLRNTYVRALFDDLVIIHCRTYELLESAVPHALNGGMSLEDHVAAIRLNRDRVRLRQKIDESFGCAPSEIKSYYTGESDAV